MGDCSVDNFLTPDEAINVIADLKDQGILTPESFNDVISQLEPEDGAGKTTILYSGGYETQYGVISTNSIANSLAETDGFMVIDNPDGKELEPETSEDL